MELTADQQQALHAMLVEASLRFTKPGFFMASTRLPEMDALVAAGALTVEEGQEPWGWCVVYKATEQTRLMIGLLSLTKGTTPGGV
jgi:hypothetical protein